MRTKLRYSCILNYTVSLEEILLKALIVTECRLPEDFLDVRNELFTNLLHSTQIKIIECYLFCGEMNQWLSI